MSSGWTQASRVMAVVRSSVLASGIVTWSLIPSNVERGAVFCRRSVRVGPLTIVPVLPVPEESVAVVPLLSSKP